jgi:hypothetical protein
MTRYLLLSDSYGFFVRRPLWREKESVFYYAAGGCQRSLSRVRVPWDSRPYFTVSDLRPLFVASYDSQGHGGGIRPRLHTGWLSRNLNMSLSHVTTDGQSASLAWYKAPIRGLRPDFFPFGIWNTSNSYALASVGRPLWREDGSVFCICRWPLPAQSFSVLVPWDLRPYITVSDLRLPFSSPPTTRRVTVEVFDPASTRVK